MIVSCRATAEEEKGKQQGRASVGPADKHRIVGADKARRFAVLRANLEPAVARAHDGDLRSLGELRHDSSRTSRLFINRRGSNGLVSTRLHSSGARTRRGALH